MKKRNLNRGFTLIELLVVISVIGILAAVVLASLNSARGKGRDAAMISSIKQVQTALELFYSNNGYYPTANDQIFPSGSDALTTALVPTYISKLPTAPSGSNFRYHNANENPATYYAILVPYEVKADCYVCGGSVCGFNMSWWSVNMCQ